MTEMSLEDVLKGEEVVEPETPEETTETEEPEKVEAVAEESEEVADEPIETKGVEVEPPSTEDTRQVPLAAVLDERDKRKELQKRLDELQAEKESDKPDFWENPEAAVEARVSEKVGKLEQQFTNGYLSLSMQYSRSFHNDFDEAKEAFAKAAKENPALAQQALAHEMPGEYIYKAGKQFMELDAVDGDINALREKIRNEERARILKEMDAKKVDVPEPLTNETSAGSPRDKVEGTEETLESILG